MATRNAVRSGTSSTVQSVANIALQADGGAQGRRKERRAERKNVPRIDRFNIWATRASGTASVLMLGVASISDKADFAALLGLPFFLGGFFMGMREQAASLPHDPKGTGPLERAFAQPREPFHQALLLKYAAVSTRLPELSIRQKQERVALAQRIKDVPELSGRDIARANSLAEGLYCGKRLAANPPLPPAARAETLSELKTVLEDRTLLPTDPEELLQAVAFMVASSRGEKAAAAVRAELGGPTSRHENDVLAGPDQR
jgi:hypothetical protein